MSDPSFMTSPNSLIDEIRNSPNYLGKPIVSIPSVYQWHSTTGTERTLMRTDSETFEPAILTCIVFITSDNYFLTSCGMWKGPSEITPNFTSVKPSCTGSRPQQELLRQDFTNVIQNLQTIANMSNATSERKGLFLEWSSPNTKIRFRHHLFSLVSASNNTEDEKPDDENSKNSDELGDEFSLDQWPARHPAARDALRELQFTNTHQLNPIPAYDNSGRLIPPTQYQAQLQEALVRMDFTLNYWHFKENYTFAADIEAVRVLESPSTRIAKHKTIHATDPMIRKKVKKF